MLVLISLPNHLTYLTSVVVVLCLTLTYTAAGGLMFCLGLMQGVWIQELNNNVRCIPHQLMYCLGLMQGVWIQELNIATSDASLINSVNFAITLY